ncbi:hypothetical protein VNI00_017718 [Paramarasmius palmivorus]|uniref:F-box domain-containing protein n=1 Tax=Paramarasmius palmivorus TaxID=297713 RepID=A0AAW0B3I0_9AGAR
MMNLDFMAYPIQNPVFDSLSLIDLARMRAVSHSLNAQLRQYDLTAFGLEKMYGRFFPTESSKTRFRIKQAETEALVSGSTLVSVLSRRYFNPSDLDVFLRHDHVMSMGQELEDLGFKFSPLPTVMDGKKKKSEQQMEIFEEAVVVELASWIPNTGNVTDRYNNSSVAGVFNFVNQEGFTIQLVATKGEPIEAILGFHSIMNFATATHLVSLYPRTSFLKNEAIYLKDFTPPVIKAVQKYEQRGWITVDMISAEEALDYNSEVSFKTRWVGDPHCWITELEGIPGFNIPSDAYRGLWITSWHHCCPAVRSIRVIVNRFQSKSLSRTYLVCWEAEKAIWSHHCFRMLEEKIRWRMAHRAPVVSGSGHPTLPVLRHVAVHDDRVPALLDVRPQPQTNTSDTPFGIADRNQWKYINEHQSCIHRSTRNVANMENAIIEYLEGLYPLFDHTFKTNDVILRMKGDFGFARKYYAGYKGHDCYPTGHTISAIIRCVDLIKHIQQREAVMVLSSEETDGMDDLYRLRRAPPRVIGEKGDI